MRLGHLILFYTSFDRSFIFIVYTVLTEYAQQGTAGADESMGHKDFS